MRRVSAVCLCLMGAMGCLGEAEGDADAGSSSSDAGVTRDAGSSADSGVSADGGTTDAGIADASSMVDAGNLATDAGTRTDAGHDAGVGFDAGILDAGNGTDGGTTCTTLATDPYVATFAVDENPVSEGCRWVVGQSDGLDWNNPKVVSGHAVASILSGTPNRYNDSIATLRASVAAEQYAQGTVYRAAGYDPSPSKHEVELLLRFALTPNSARGYEVMWGITGYLAVVRWNGPLGDYTTLSDSGDPGIGVPVDGDVLKAQIAGSTLTVFKNGSKVATIDVTSAGGQVWASGHVGMGFWPVDSAIIENYGWKAWRGGSL